MNYYQFHIGDYVTATTHLNFLEDAAYSRLLRRYYISEKPLPSDMKTVQRLVGARSEEECNAVETVLHEFFILKNGAWHNSRCDEEIAKYQDKQEKAKCSIKARWDKSKGPSERNTNVIPMQYERNTNVVPTKYERNTNVILPNTQYPRANTQEPKPKNQKPEATSKYGRDINEVSSNTRVKNLKPTCAEFDKNELNASEIARTFLEKLCRANQNNPNHTCRRSGEMN